jgi:hypothetical protein
MRKIFEDVNWVQTKYLFNFFVCLLSNLRPRRSPTDGGGGIISYSPLALLDMVNGPYFMGFFRRVHHGLRRERVLDRFFSSPKQRLDLTVPVVSR